MKQISSKMTKFQKRVFPIMWFGFLGAFILISTILPKVPNKPLVLPYMMIPLLMAGFGYYMMKKLVFDLVDEVYDCGDHLLVKNNGMEEKIFLSNIVNVNYSEFTRPPRVSLMLRFECGLGKEIAFYPPSRVAFFKKNPMIVDLIMRIDQARLQK